MFLDLTESQLELQSTLRAYFESLMTPERRDAMEGRRAGQVYRETVRQMGKDGWLGVGWPKEWGGQGYTPLEQLIFFEEANRAGVPLPFVTLNTVGPALNVYGTEEQKAFFLPKILAGELHFSIGYSEPTAGTDLASLKTKAVRDGDEWIINGQKIWTTGGHESDWIWLATRTDPDVPKHAGISMFIVPMDSEGVEVRPIHQIDGGTHFNEVFFTDVRISVDNLLGDLNNGWRMATAMLMYERVAIGSGTTGGISTDRTDRLIEAARKRGLDRDPALRQKLIRLHILETCLSLVAMRTRAELKAGRTPGPGGSVGKLATVQIADLHTEVSMAIVGASGVAWEDEADGHWQRQALTSLQAGIAGGTSEIQRNIIGDRVLGLPRDISVDRGVPFKDLKVGTQAG